MILERPSSLKRHKRRMDKMIGGSSSNRNNKSSQRLMFLILALGMATVSVMLLGKLREGRVFGLLVRDQDQQIMTLQIILERERETSKALKRKLEDFRSNIVYVKSQNTELSRKLIEAQTTSEQLQNIQGEMEKSLGEKHKEIETLSEKLEELNPKVAHLTELLNGKEVQLKEVNEQLDKLSNVTESSNQDGMKSEQHEETTTEEVQTNQNDDDGNKENNEMSQETPHEMNMEEVKENGAEKTIEGEKEAKEEQKEINKDDENGEDGSTEVKNVVEKVVNNAVQENEAAPNQELMIEVKEDKNENNGDNKNDLSQEITNSEANKQNEEVKEESKNDDEVSTKKEDVKDDGVKPVKITGGNEHKVRGNKKGKNRKRRTAISRKSREIKYQNENSKEVEGSVTNNNAENNIKAEAGVDDQSNPKIADTNVANEDDEGVKIAEGESIKKEINVEDSVKEESSNAENYKELGRKKNDSENADEIEMNTSLDKPQEDGAKKPEEENAGNNNEATKNGEVSNASEEIGMVSKEENPEKSENSINADDATKDQTIGQ